TSPPPRPIPRQSPDDEPPGSSPTSPLLARGDATAKLLLPRHDDRGVSRPFRRRRHPLPKAAERVGGAPCRRGRHWCTATEISRRVVCRTRSAGYAPGMSPFESFIGEVEISIIDSV